MPVAITLLLLRPTSFPMAETLVEGGRRAQWCPPGTTDPLGARKAKGLHQVNHIVAQSNIRRQLSVVLKNLCG
jgi:hypothetical protein